MVMVFIFLHENILWILIRSTYVPLRGASNEYPQHVFDRNKKIINTFGLKKMSYLALC